ncbi:MAG: long-chain-acyl-CoA synthetase [Alphaproteobacteria bacterium]|nr:long-chain-acyl-CoA synthetase [Alphaproteobacteria bacterium]MBL7099760.1 long-chain-acyl-CoA synthetase [Alphaproteobacteria bacterium]
MGLAAALKRESTYIAAIARTLIGLRAVKPDSPHTIVDEVEARAREIPDAVAFYFLDRTMTFRALNAGADRVAHWAKGNGVMRGDVVALLMENRPEYVMTWLGLLKAGAVVALINTNLRGTPLAHSISIAGAKLAIVGAELAATYGEAAPLLEPRPAAWCAGGTCPGLPDFDAACAAAGGAPADKAWRTGITCKDKAFYIYTSGTTGLPKASNFSHLRMLFMMHGFVGGLNVKATDRIYNVLPLYHSAGGVCAVGMGLLTGGAVIMKRKFSVHEFWEDVHRYDATIFQYIGELCRYLLNAPPTKYERDHKIRTITGNGLRPEIWKNFQERFAIPKIVEFYGATEGNVSMLNYDGTPGAVGRVPSYMRGIFTTRIVKFDVEKEEPIRGSDGCCVECADGEVGECIGKIDNAPGKTFDGYTQASDTQKKVLADVFAKGDRWFRTGDLMRRDADGYFYFVDRIGDTFRWKGENVATSEVSEALSVVPGVKEANVYGVGVPGQDGRAGMAALVTGSGFDIASLAPAIARNLPSYAQPVFVRLLPELEITGTFKQRKVDLVKEGFDPDATRDPLYWLDHARGQYVPLTPADYADVIAGSKKI